MTSSTKVILSALSLLVGACTAPTSQPTGGSPPIGAGLSDTAPRYAVQANPPADCRPPLPTGMVTYQSAIENELLRLLNDARTSAGAPALARDDLLHIRDAARSHSYEVSDQDIPALNSPDGKTPGDRLLRYCVGYSDLGETVYRVRTTSDTPAAAILNLMLSDARAKANLLNPAWSLVGIGVYRSRNFGRSYFVTIDLVKP